MVFYGFGWWGLGRLVEVYFWLGGLGIWLSGRNISRFRNNADGILAIWSISLPGFPGNIRIDLEFGVFLYLEERGKFLGCWHTPLWIPQSFFGKEEQNLTG